MINELEKLARDVAQQWIKEWVKELNRLEGSSGLEELKPFDQNALHMAVTISGLRFAYNALQKHQGTSSVGVTSQPVHTSVHHPLFQVDASALLVQLLVCGINLGTIEAGVSKKLGQLLSTQVLDERLSLARSFGVIYEGLLSVGLTSKEKVIRGTSHILWSTTRSARQRAQGSHFTPRAITQPMVNEVLRPLLQVRDIVFDQKITDSPLRICDPSVGAGAFLLEVAGQLYDWERSVRLDQLSSSSSLEREELLIRHRICQGLYGVDIDPLAIWVSQLSLALFIGTHHELEYLDSLNATSLVKADALLDLSSKHEPGMVTHLERAPLQSWELLFPEVFCHGGFDAVVGNPPWVSYSGRGAHPLTESNRAAFTARFELFKGWRALHNLFIELALRLTKSGGRILLILPAQVADLKKYEAVRQMIHGALLLPEKLPYFGERAFESVTQPTFSLLGTRSKHRVMLNPDHSGTELLLDISQTELSPRSQQVMHILHRAPRPPHSSFGDKGFNTGSHGKSLIMRSPEGDCAPIRVGKDLQPYKISAPSHWIRIGWQPGPDQRAIFIPPVERYHGIPIVLRQTAKRPIATLHTEPTYFRNSVLACLGLPDVPHQVTVAWLNSTLIAWYHLMTLREANQQAFPQVKVRHLRNLPLPSWSSLKLEELTSLVTQLDQHGIDHDQVRASLDLQITLAYGLSHDDHLHLVDELETVLRG